MKKKKIVIAHCVVSLSGGVGAMIINYFDHIQGDYEVHIVTQDYVSDEYVSLFKNRGYILHLVPSKKDGVIKNISSLCKVFKDINCDIVHAHMTTTNAFPMFAAILAGVKIRISHSHLDMKLNWFWKMVCFFNKVFSTNLVACGEEAGKCLYGNSDFIIFNNAIDLKKYKYNLTTRENLRNKYKIKSNEKVFIHVGRFTEQKNHFFLIDVFEKIFKKCKDSCLVLVGEGELEDDVVAYVKNKHLLNNVYFIGMVNNVYDYLQMSDAFLLPSLFEGLCIAAVEAQAVGVPCLLSDQVDKKTKIKDNVYFCSIDSSQKWADKAIDLSSRKFDLDNEKLEKSGYDIEEEARKLDEFYKSQLAKKRINK